MPNNRNKDVAVVGSPSTNTELTLDLLQEATENDWWALFRPSRQRRTVRQLYQLVKSLVSS